MNTVSSAIAAAATAAQETPRGYQQYPQVPSQQYPVYQQYPQQVAQQVQPAPHFVPEQLQFVPEQLQYLQYPQYYQYPHFTGGYYCEIQYVSPFIVSKSNSPLSQGSLVSSSQPPQQQDAASQVPLTGLVVSM